MFGGMEEREEENTIVTTLVVFFFCNHKVTLRVLYVAIARILISVCVVTEAFDLGSSWPMCWILR